MSAVVWAELTQKRARHVSSGVAGGPTTTTATPAASVSRENAVILPGWQSMSGTTGLSSSPSTHPPSLTRPWRSCRVLARSLANRRAPSADPSIPRTRSTWRQHAVASGSGRACRRTRSTSAAWPARYPPTEANDLLKVPTSTSTSHSPVRSTSPSPRGPTAPIEWASSR